MISEKNEYMKEASRTPIYVFTDIFLDKLKILIQSITMH